MVRYGQVSTLILILAGSAFGADRIAMPYTPPTFMSPLYRGIVFKALPDEQTPSSPTEVGRFLPTEGGRMLDSASGALYEVEAGEWRVVAALPKSITAGEHRHTERVRTVLGEDGTLYAIAPSDRGGLSVDAEALADRLRMQLAFAERRARSAKESASNKPEDENAKREVEVNQRILDVLNKIWIGGPQ